MKTFVRLLLACLTFAPAALLAASFEGKVTFKMTAGRDKPVQMTYNIKGDKIRMEMQGQKDSAGMIMDTSKREMTIIMDEQKTYMVMALPQGAVDAINQQEEEVNMVKTNETEKILGYTATKYILTEKDGTETEAWLAEGLGTFMGFSNKNSMGRGRGQAAKAWERALEGKELFPLRVVTWAKGASPRAEKGKSADKAKAKGRAGNESFRMEVTAIDRTSLPDSLFNPPAGYQKFDMGGMFKGMMPGMPGKR